MKQLEFDLPEGRDRRDLGMQQSRDAAQPWHDRFLAFLIDYARSRWTDFLVEDVRAAWLEQGGDEPRSPHAYGAVCNMARRLGRIARVSHRQARDPRSHAREMPTWRAT